jgi:hypothetical protein
MIRRHGHLLLALALAPLFHCSDLAMTGNGGSSQTVNATVILSDTTVSIATEDTAVHNLALNAYSADYLPFEKIGYADSLAATPVKTIRWNAPNQNSFSFLLKANQGAVACLLQNIVLRKGAHETIACKLTSCRSVAGLVLPGATSAQQTGQYALSIAGSPFYSVTDSTRRFVMKNMPFGAYTIRVRSMTKHIMISTIDYSIAIDSLFGNKQLVMMLP